MSEQEWEEQHTYEAKLREQLLVLEGKLEVLEQEAFPEPLLRALEERLGTDVLQAAKEALPSEAVAPSGGSE